MVPVVGGEDDGGVVQQAPISQRVDDLAHLVVYLLDEAGVVGAGTLLLVVGPVGQVHAHALPRSDMVGDEAGRVPGRRDRVGHVGGVELVREVGRGVVGVVRAGEADHHGEGPVRAVALDEAPRLTAGEAVPGVVPGHVGGRGASARDVVAVLVPRQLAESALLQVVVVVVAHVRPELVLADDPVLEAVPGVPRVEVHLADRGGVVARRGEYLGPRADSRVVVVGPDGVQVVGDPVLDGVHAGQQRRPGGHAQGRRRVGVVVADAVVGDPVDVGGVDEGCPVAAQEVTSELVGEEEDDVRRSAHCRSLRAAGVRRAAGAGGFRRWAADAWARRAGCRRLPASPS